MVINLPIFDLSKEEEEDELLFGTRLLPENMWPVLLALTSSYKLTVGEMLIGTSTLVPVTSEPALTCIYSTPQSF